MVNIFLHLTTRIVSQQWLFVGNRIQATKIAMALLTDIDVGLSRVPPNSISSEMVTTMVKDLTNLGYQPTIKYY